MARPLTNTDSDGVRYERPPSVDAQIDEVDQLSPAGLRTLQLD